MSTNILSKETETVSFRCSKQDVSCPFGHVFQKEVACSSMYDYIRRLFEDVNLFQSVKVKLVNPLTKRTWLWLWYPAYQSIKAFRLMEPRLPTQHMICIINFRSYILHHWGQRASGRALVSLSGVIYSLFTGI